MKAVKVFVLSLVAWSSIAIGWGSDESARLAGSGNGAAVAATSPSEKAASDASEAGGAARHVARRRGPLVKLRDSQFGPVLFSGNDRALYLFTRDRRNRTRCYGACAAAWPPFYAKGRPHAGRGVDADLLGTIGRRDGGRQVTYRGQPLYFYVDDPRGRVLCNDVFEFGGTWFALDARGDPPS